MTRRDAGGSERRCRSAAAERRLGPFEVALVAIAVGVVALALVWPAHAATLELGPTTLVRAEAGDSAWSLAARNPMPGQTTRQVAERITSLNGLDERPLAEGEIVEVPVAGVTGVVMASR